MDWSAKSPTVRYQGSLQMLPESGLLAVDCAANKEALLGIESMWTEACNVATTDRVARMLHKTNKAAEW